tara:strand:- start:232 stop:843 length:612 start_codon:yes stop_codon:yes gene_type:complete
MSNNNRKLVPDDLITTITDFKSKLGDKGVTVDIHGKDYATVAPRVGIARQNLGAKLQIVTEVISANSDTVVMKATGLISGNVVATGHAEEQRSASRINKTSAMENAETSAIGRMLAFLGMTNDNIASAEEVSAAIEQQDPKIQQVLKELEAVSHQGSYEKWITNNEKFMKDLNKNNPLTYKEFVKKFTEIKINLTRKGVIKNG